jgi:hypothetical protein
MYSSSPPNWNPNPAGHATYGRSSGGPPVASIVLTVSGVASVLVETMFDLNVDGATSSPVVLGVILTGLAAVSARAPRLAPIAGGLAVSMALRLLLPFAVRLQFDFGQTSALVASTIVGLGCLAGAVLVLVDATNRARTESSPALIAAAACGVLSLGTGFLALEQNMINFWESLASALAVGRLWLFPSIVVLAIVAKSEPIRRGALGAAIGSVQVWASVVSNEFAISDVGAVLSLLLVVLGGAALLVTELAAPARPVTVPTQSWNVPATPPTVQARPAGSSTLGTTELASVGSRFGAFVIDSVIL